jgi:hypothetical protein
LLAALDNTPLPVGLGDIAPILIGDEVGSGVNQLVERAKAIVASADAPDEVGMPLSGDTPDASPSSGRKFGRSQSNQLISGVLAFGVTFVLSISAIFGFWHWRHETNNPPPEIAKQLPGPSEPLPGPSEQLPGFSQPLPRPSQPPPGPSEQLPEIAKQLPGPSEPPPGSPGSVASSASLESEWPLLILLLLVGVMIGLGASWAWSVRARRRPKRLEIVTLMQGAAADGTGQVFVSYSHKDVETVEQLVRQIKGMGYSVWIDQQVTGPQRYAKQIVGAIRTSKVVALMCSQNAFTSDSVIREINVAGDMKKPFIAFQLDLSEFPDEVLYFVSGFPRIPIANLNPERLRTEFSRLAVT